MKYFLLLILLLKFNIILTQNLTPNLKIEPAKEYFIKGEKAKFKAFVNNMDNYSIKWFKNGEFIIKNFNDSTIIENIREGDIIEGILYDSSGNVYLNNSNKIIVDLREEFTNPVLTGEYKTGKKLELNSNETYEVLWYKNDTLINNYSEFGKPQLVFENDINDKNLFFPHSVFLDDFNTLFISEPTGGRIIKFNETTNENYVDLGLNGYSNKSNTYSNIENIRPNKFIINSKGEKFISDGFKIIKFLPGKLQSIEIINVSSSGGYITDFQISEKYIYILNSNQSRIERYSKDGKNPEIVAGNNGKGTGNNQLNNPGGIAIQNDSLIFISESDDRVIKKWNIGKDSGEIIFGKLGFKRDFYSPQYIVNTYDELLVQPQKLKLLNDSTLYIGDLIRVVKLNLTSLKGQIVSGNHYPVFGKQTNGYAYLVDFEIKNGFIYSTEHNNSRVLKWEIGKNSGKLIYGGNNVFNSNDLKHFMQIGDLVVTNNDEVIYFDINTNKVIIYNSLTKSRNLLIAFNSCCTTPNATSLNLNSKGDLIINSVDKNIYKIAKENFWINQPPFENIKSNKNNTNEVDYYSDFVLDKEDNIYAVNMKTYFLEDLSNNKILKLNLDKSEEILFPLKDDDVSRFSFFQNNFSKGIEIDEDKQSLYILDTGKRVIKYNYKDSTAIDYFTSNNNSPQSISQIKLDNENNMFFVFRYDNTVVKLNTNGLEIIAGSKNYFGGKLNNLLSEPNVICFDKFNSLYINDNNNKRLLKYSNQNSKHFIPEEEGLYFAIIKTKYGQFKTPSYQITYLDEDDDGIIDKLDRCLNTPKDETVNNNGCSISQLDSDSDGVNDKLDKCPESPKSEEVNKDGCALSEIDTDNDGINDKNDNCPDTPENEEINSKGCSINQLDDDNDGVKNILDKCPSTPSGTQVNSDGCELVLAINNEPKGLNLYPNPFKDKLKITFDETFGEKVEVNIYDSNGRKAFSDSNVYNEKELKLNKLSSGIYLLKIQSILNEKVSSIKIIKD